MARRVRTAFTWTTLPSNVMPGVFPMLSTWLAPVAPQRVAMLTSEGLQRTPLADASSDLMAPVFH